SFDIVSAFALRVRFDDNTEQTIDFRPILAGELYSPLRDLELFNQVRIDPEVETLVWPNGADFDPATLHDWPSHEQAFRELARGGEAVQALTLLFPEKDAGTVGNLGEGGERLAIEGCQGKPLTAGQLDEQGVVNRHARLDRAGD